MKPNPAATSLLATTLALGMAACKAGNEGYNLVNLDAQGRGTIVVDGDALGKANKVQFLQAQSSNAPFYETVPVAVPAKGETLSLTFKGGAGDFTLPCKLTRDKDPEAATETVTALCAVDFSKASRAGTLTETVPAAVHHR
ncbi:MAG: hypothetical protein PW734_10765 [Verrucomicrobium sp.]|nr:hypothetical protein [Verrucomicrobium sp.]